MSGWSNGLCDCFSDCGLCFKTMCCGPCQLAKARAALAGHECGIGDLIPSLCCYMCCSMQTRSDVRQKYGIDGSIVTDCLFTLCLNLCSSVQVYRELEGRGEPVVLCADK
ncbi:uncharacterized protein AMSG_03604 [Thecamonas trahens ATCC 50062]|uniref:PLAC8 family protein n=1 Tax=Thecamonas trahens ATCC 50062 TaxID=461836 RepID=A0A0L0D538_THETB|nr:hypothetical protein AMSG_03604 [Thecamonas trahens ATCC 50062]KNC47176.1 hypothetical protein AMSG_03604 [Thecamonas trahens ATCC 50062]|eukprot:XP_013759950.1 hypothetical protein AMSG_03604 [Thecamonas trahens ATCC 50062]